MRKVAAVGIYSFDAKDMRKLYPSPFFSRLFILPHKSCAPNFISPKTKGPDL